MTTEKINEAELKEWKDFWNSETGKKAIEKMETLKQSNLNYAMELSDKVTNPGEPVLAAISRAKGIQIVIDDIKTGINLADEKEKEGGKAK